MESRPAAGAAPLDCVEVDLAPGDGDDHVVAVPFESVDQDHFLLAVVDDGGQMAAIGAEMEIVLDAVVGLLLLARVDHPPLAAGLRQINESLAVGAEPRPPRLFVTFLRDAVDLRLAVEQDELAIAELGA